MLLTEVVLIGFRKRSATFLTRLADRLSPFKFLDESENFIISTQMPDSRRRPNSQTFWKSLVR